ncbi:SAM-dependent methyltransferase [Gluconobacter sphaericus]|uniref:Cyclopropane-fatty-acyl-phospholipid synthase n=1 Tax=Gluconobacter sphaericus NBRC 12467 TaxID=1307951 RepID=A0AA37WCG9_9PROT|nr:cyclopropane-fatty-acyl-phospholipid synthase family protein [Gluconobacter sphaericus]MBF0885662.1 class I SAM-dependent methyltransferase [Gluconobacter sphaericus]GEB42256.1 cyclopropane-fatty-acyl-phospholipid synthase [Gluconobacter sphaericus NBRC 12467]GLQ84846.1 cyclopropane-fatty-acyl-phospholipid synthase [Gluconobacter sphaericus NBRC 12467]GLQ84999.1 cyclopropane-fatty-acyl-phospholipid synthase [Gluconobacter sphaericus NBRC 12467]
MRRILGFVLRKFIQTGSLRVTFSDGTVRTYRGRKPGLEAGLHLLTKQAERALIINSGLAFGEEYMAGSIVPDGCTLETLLTVLMENINGHGHVFEEIEDRLRYVTRAWKTLNSLKKSRSNVAHHYDLNGALYDLFLDKDRQYSCAYFAREDMTLEEAQVAKKRHIASKLNLDRPGLAVLDIGCGWGGMALTLAKDYGAKVLGITLSREQLEVARKRAKDEGLEDQVRFELIDYRNLHQQFDRIVSVGMFEHVGPPQFEAFFKQLKACLKPDGVALIHSIGRMDGPGTTNPWIQKYIFPGGYSPALSETLAAIERSGLWMTDCEVLRLHYARTLAEWRKRFDANRDKIQSLYDERFVRMFEFYLVGAELAFRVQGHMNFQLQLTRSIDAVPFTRDYMFERERESAKS